MSSIRVRLLLTLLAMLGFVAVVIGIVTYRNVLGEAEALFDYQLQQMALSLRDQGEISQAQANTLADQQLDFVVQIWTADGRSIYASRAHSALPTRALLGLATVTVEGQGWRTYSVATDGRVIQVAQPLQIRRRLATDAAVRSVVPLLLLAPLMAILVWWVAARTLAPLQRVAAAVRRRDEQSLNALPTDGLPDEVEPLVRALNALLHRLDQSLETQRAFVADAAHELRSPITALKLQLEVLKRAADEPARLHAVEALTAGTERAGRLVEQLLTLARSEPGAPATPFETADLSELVREAVADCVPFALARRSTLTLAAEAPVALVCDRNAIAALARNLIDNALRYSPPGSTVEVQVSEQAGTALLQIDDAGPGIPPVDRERVFDRFYRRAAGDTAGTGLGLPIVRSVALRHGATLSLGDSPRGGLRIGVHFPTAASTRS